MFREHSITIGEKNTWDDWHLQPSSRPLVAAPKQKTNYIKIPGANGSLDLSDVPQGYPVFEDRTGSWEFIVENGFRSWQVLYSEIMNYVQGRQFKVTLEDDFSYYYEGRLIVSDWNSDNSGKWSKIKFDYTLNPFKYSWNTTSEDDGDWLWDPFNFESDVIPDGCFKNIKIEAADEWVDLDYSMFVGRAPVVPVITVNSKQGKGMLISFYNSRIADQWITAEFPDGSSRLSDMIFSKMSDTDKVYLRVRGSGTITVDFRRGML